MQFFSRIRRLLRIGGVQKVWHGDGYVYPKVHAPNDSAHDQGVLRQLREGSRVRLEKHCRCRCLWFVAVYRTLWHPRLAGYASQVGFITLSRSRFMGGHSRATVIGSGF